MSKFSLGLVLLLSCAAASGAPCGNAPLSTYVSLGSTGCSVGAYTFFNFGFQVFSSVGSPAVLGTADLNLSPTTVLNGAGFDFLPVSGGPGFSLSSGQAVTYRLTYTVDPPPPIIWGFEEDMQTNTPVAPGFARINASLCVGGVFLANCFTDPVALTVYHNGNSDFRLQDARAIQGAYIVGVRTDIILDATAGGSSSFTGFSQFATIPEPGSLVMLASGLLAGWGIRRRRC